MGGLEENSVEVQVEITGTHQLVFTNPARLRALAVLVDYYISPSTAAPTATPTPALHRQPRRQHRLQLDDALHSGCQPLHPLLRLRGLFIISQDSELIELDLNAGDTLKVSYFTVVRVASTSTASPPASPIEFLILDPANEPLLEVGALEENSVEVQVAITGTHQLVFTNPARLRALAVLVDYATNPRAAAPTVTPTPTPTVSLRRQHGLNSTTPSTQAASLSIPTSGSENYSS